MFRAFLGSVGIGYTVLCYIMVIQHIVGIMIHHIVHYAEPSMYYYYIRPHTDPAVSTIGSGTMVIQHYGCYTTLCCWCYNTYYVFLRRAFYVGIGYTVLCYIMVIQHIVGITIPHYEFYAEPFVTTISGHIYRLHYPPIIW